MKNTKTYTNTQIAMGYATDSENNVDESLKNSAMSILMEVFDKLNSPDIPSADFIVDPIFG
jgi:hypothetical protein